MFKTTSDSMTKQSNSPKFSLRKPCCKFKGVFVILLGILVSLAILLALLIFLDSRDEQVVINKEDTIGTQINELAQKAKFSNLEILKKEEVLSSDDEAGLPVVDQDELTEKYFSDLKEIVSNLEQQVQLIGNQEGVDINTVRGIKDRVMEEVVPQNYQDLHLDLVLALDLMISGDANQAKEIFYSIKRKVE